MSVKIGDLIRSQTFEGIGKVVSVDEILGEIKVSFFESPINHNSRIQTLELQKAQIANLNEEAVVYCIHPTHGKWCRVRYGGSRPNNKHLIIYRRGESDIVDISDVYVLNLPKGVFPNPKEFLLSRSNDAPYYADWRSQFVFAYIEQRSACRSLSSFLSSSVELEPHQLAVVRRVLQDEHKKYLLADEVGLGKTIEAGMILRELLLQDLNATAVVAVPETLVQQWRSELDERFFLGELFDSSLIICSHNSLSKVLVEHKPSILILDEAHLMAPFAWSGKLAESLIFQQLAEAAQASESCLLLSGTPLSGNEVNFLAMLHLISPESYPLTEEGVIEFKTKIKERERLGGIYQALKDTNDNSTLTDNVELLANLFPHDSNLHRMVGDILPLIDWMSEEKGEDRSNAIKGIREYLGENYRLHQRLLRNRREDPVVGALFPGLNGAVAEKWSINEESIAIDQYLDAYRSEYFDSNCSSMAINPSNFNDWLDAYFTSPLLIKNKVSSLLDNTKNELTHIEVETLQSLFEFAEFEQVQKDSLLIQCIKSWFKKYDDGKLVIFCGEKFVARHVSSILAEVFGEHVELHTNGVTPKYLTSAKVKILICDKDGEDGLNLHGGRKLIIHYSLPRSISRIEQRIGRVNRYSADIRAFPIQNIVLHPKSNSFAQMWFNLLNEGVGIFNESVASLQYVLEELIEDAWSHIAFEGPDAIKEVTAKLGGELGLLQIEKQRVRTQEQLNNMEADIEAVSSFTEALIDSDGKAEQVALKMSEWITRGLQFNRLDGELPSTFRYQYHAGTLMDIDRFISNCIIGLDFEKSSYKSPVTSLMSFDRVYCSKGHRVYPFRYGQPFIESIYKAMATDTRGISSAKVRLLNNVKLQQPIAGFKIEWLVSHKKSKDSATQQKIYDEIFPPTIKKAWYFSSGKKIEDQNIINLLERDYEPYDKSTCELYKDINLRAERWAAIEHYFPAEHWSELVDTVYQKSLSELSKDTIAGENADLAFDCLSMSVVILSDESGLT
ncbi:protein DpdE [Pseudoalteromonas sp.]|uniref:protein DpdE n=1 Tax=Pseudoalteromonas sp. TaxID=53249 RepID=UPI002613BAED|nr:protein DpdE [Pseudoalteromonas sp.]MCP4588328.1 hypothetical protein [Pseudoalteromonas sp.]